MWRNVLIKWTSYKKPGPPTPGKNGGRLSLQETESNVGALWKASTRNPLKAIFRKKDHGDETSYKKPGPPTPGKNGGRLSLQETEVLKLSNDGATVRTAGKNPLKSIFKKKGSWR